MCCGLREILLDKFLLVKSLVSYWEGILAKVCKVARSVHNLGFLVPLNCQSGSLLEFALVAFYLLHFYETSQILSL